MKIGDQRIADLEIVWQLLDPFEREILYYWAVEEMTAQEISHQIDVPVKPVCPNAFTSAGPMPQALFVVLETRWKTLPLGMIRA